MALRKKLLEIASTLMLSPSEITLERTEKEFDILLEEIEALKKIDVTGVEPMWTPVQKVKSYLREDIVGEVMKVEDVIKNVSNSKDNYIVIPRVVK